MRPEKANIVQDLQAWIKGSPYVIVVDYTGMTVEQFSELRNRLSEVQSELHVVKNTFIRRALSNESRPDLAAYLQGQTAVAFGKSDLSAAAKILKNFKAEFTKPAIRAGLLDSTELDAKGVLAIADLPPKAVLQAQLLGLLQTPATRLASILGIPATQLAQVIKAKAEKGA
ncbi:MAG: 50S ribosomal protein L10 [Candidatus Methylacidiphilales bacterium]|nr:50S ribosomal protein L10 [Candidatus Methylacidiphilales bacterium]